MDTKCELGIQSLSSLDLTQDASDEILVAEDNDCNFLLLKSMLRDRKLVRAINGVEAVDMASKKRYSAILMDIKMPQMDGLEATSLIREFDKEILIIAITANAFDSDKQNAINAGCNHFLSKPVQREALEKLLDQ